jgi:hypothetical protein
MTRFFARNLDGRGRVARGIAAAVLLLGAGALVLGSEPWRMWTGTGLLASGAFVMFEALRGWCIMRACGIKTKR